MTAQGRRVSVLGVPTSAGSHNPGQEKAPAAWRAAGLITELRAAGLDVEDRGDLPAAPYRPVEPVDGLRDVDRVVEVARRVADEVAAIRADGRLPLVLGGDCTITLGALAGFGDGGLVYFDGDADLATPERSDSAVADTMGMTHMLGGGSPRLAGFGPRSPLLEPAQVVLFGFDPAELDTAEWTELASRHLYAAPAPAVRADPAGQARQARAYLERRTGAYLVHLDVDVLHTGLFPLANFPHFAGLTLEAARVCLNEFTSGEKFGGLIITEVNPGNDPDGRLIKTLVAVVAGALAAEAPPAADAHGGLAAAAADGRFSRCAVGRGSWRARISIRAAGFADGAEFHASSRRDLSGDWPISRIRVVQRRQPLLLRHRIRAGDDGLPVLRLRDAPGRVLVPPAVRRNRSRVHAPPPVRNKDLYRT